jgi:hypothetical protein
MSAWARLTAGLSLQYAATGVYSDGSESDLSSSVTWASGSPAVASIDGNGLATGLLAGASEIAASEDGVTGFTRLTVTEAEVVTVGVFPPVEKKRAS